MRFLGLTLAVIVAGILGLAGGWFLAGRIEGPAITITSPDKFIGRAGSLDVTVDSPTTVAGATAAIEQNGQSMTVATYADGAVPQSRVSLKGPIGKSVQPALVNGPAQLVVTATRPVFFGLRTAESSTKRDLQVRLDPPRVAVVSLHHFINLGGAEFVVLRATPEDVEAGIRVGDTEYRAWGSPLDARSRLQKDSGSGRGSLIWESRDLVIW